MAPNLVGQHWAHSCSECQFQFRFTNCQGDQQPEIVVCPNCGNADKTSPTKSKTEADQVEIVSTSRYNRWDVVAFQLPGETAFGVKRLIGLPGDSIGFQHGDLLVGGSICRKPLDVQRKMRIHVHDSDFQPDLDVRRWRPSLSVSHWEQEGTGWRCIAEGESKENQQDWLRYHHWRCFSHQGERTEEFTVEDHYGYNQSMGRNLNKTDDLFLELDLSCSNETRFEFRFYRGSIAHDFEIDVAQQRLTWQQSDSGKPPVIENLDLTIPPKQWKIEFSSFDGRLEIAINQRLVFSHLNEHTYPPVNQYPLQIRCLSGELSVKRLRIWRDVFYFPLSGGQATLLSGDDTFLLLGDNVPLSFDSRHWRPADMPSESILGLIRE